jgi:hypothetical protein
MSQQQLDQGCVALQAGIVQTAHALAVLGIDIHLTAEQEGDNVHMLVRAGEVKRCPACIIVRLGE